MSHLTDLQTVTIPKWTVRLATGFFFLSMLAAVVTVISVVCFMTTIIYQQKVIRRYQVEAVQRQIETQRTAETIEKKIYNANRNSRRD